MDVAAAVVFGLFLLGAIPSMRVLLLEHRWRSSWTTEVSVAPSVDRGAYRTPAEMNAIRSVRPPTLIRFTAWTCFLFGQMFLPGLLLGLFGLIMCGLGVVSIPGLILAWKLFGLGGAMLRRESGVAIRARGLAIFTVYLNVIVLVVCAFVALAFTSARWIPLLVTPYVLLSLAHAALLHAAASRFEALDEFRVGADESASSAFPLAA